jgi:hypothetical protein
MLNLKKGDLAYVDPSTYQRMHGYEAEVVTVGKKYITVKRYANTGLIRFDFDGWEVTDRGSKSRLYESKAAYDAMMAEQAEIKHLRAWLMVQI